VRVLLEPLAQIGDERLVPVRFLSPSLAGCALPSRCLRTVSRLLPRCRAMAEIDQPCSRSAVASMSSFPVNIGRSPSVALVWTPQASEGGHPRWWIVSPPRAQDWKISMSRIWQVFSERGQANLRDPKDQVG